MLVLNVASYDELKHSKLGGSSILMGSKGVAGNSLSKEFFAEVVLDKVSNSKFIFAIWILDLVVITSPNLSPGHLILGQCSGLIRANVVGSSHDLA